MKKQELLDRCRELNLRDGDKITIKLTNSDVNAITRIRELTTLECTFVKNAMGWIHFNRYGEQKRTKSTGQSIRCCAIYIDYDNILMDIDAEKIESIESHMNISRRRKNNWNNIEDYK